MTEPTDARIIPDWILERMKSALNAPSAMENMLRQMEAERLASAWVMYATTQHLTPGTCEYDLRQADYYAGWAAHEKEHT